MEILVGTGGNQSLPITDSSVSRIHCKIEVLESGHIVVTNLSAAGTMLNGNRLVKKTIAKKDDIITLGKTFSTTVESLIENEDYSLYTCHHIVRKKYSNKESLDAFLKTSMQRIKLDNIPSYVVPVFKSTLAYYMIEEGNYKDAQELIYEAGDTIYYMQDGSELLQSIYATMLVICAQLYLKNNKLVEGLEAAQGAKDIFERLASTYPTTYHIDQKSEADEIFEKLTSLL